MTNAPMFKADQLVVAKIEKGAGYPWIGVGQVEDNYPNDAGILSIYFPLGEDALDLRAFDAPDGGPFHGVVQGAIFDFFPANDLWRLVDTQETIFFAPRDEAALLSIRLREKDGVVPEELTERFEILRRLMESY